jgi:preprotein translocase subunit SecA
LQAELRLPLPVRAWVEKEPELQAEALLERIIGQAEEQYRTRIPEAAQASFRQYERYVTLQILDAHYREHLAALDHLRQDIHLRGYAQKNPKQEYKREAFEMFGMMIEAVKLEVTKTLSTVEIRAAEEVPEVDDKPHVENVRAQHADYDEALGGPADADDAAAAAAQPAAQPTVRATQKIGRNDPCPCGSGRKYKHCHGKLA